MKMDIITSRRNQLALLLSSLGDRSKRDRAGMFAFDGRKLFLEAAAAGIPLKHVVCTQSYYEKFSSELDGFSPVIFSDGVFEKLSPENSPEGIICAAGYLDNLHKKATIYNNALFGNDGLFLASDIQDPGNLGTIARTAAAFGINELILDGGCADIYNRKTLRASMGAIFRLKITVCADLPESVKALTASGRRVFAAALNRDAAGLDSLEALPSDCFMVGNEGHGLSEDLIAASTGTVFIPMEPASESLNASQAASILLWERYKSARGRK